MKKNCYEEKTWEDFGCFHPGGQESTRRLASLEKQYRKVSGGNFLNLCCGDGSGMEWFDDYRECRFGLDCSELLLERAAAAFPSLHWICHDVKDPLPFCNAWADAVLCECSLSQFEESKDHVLQEIRRILKPEGLLLAADISWEEDHTLAGFDLLYAEEHPKWVKEFIARWVWEKGSLPSLCCSIKSPSSEKAIPGYYLGVYRR